MNQATNLIQWKNLTEEQKADFDFENYEYEMQHTNNSKGFQLAHKNPVALIENRVYHLKIEPEKWYYCEWKDGVKYPCLGKSFINEIDMAISLRPARKDEIPQEEILEDRIKAKWPDKEVVVINPCDHGVLRIEHDVSGCTLDYPHVYAQSMKGFYRYVYEVDSMLVKFRGCTLSDVKKDKTLQPVAVLFEGGE